MKVPELPLIDVFGRGGALKSSWYGDCLPSRDFPMLVDLYRQGRLDLDAFVVRGDRARRRRGGVRQDARRRRPALGGGLLMRAVDKASTSGTFSLDGETLDVDNNVWLVGDDDEGVVIDAAHDVDGDPRGVGDRRVMAIVCTHAHDDHVRVAPGSSPSGSGAPILLHPADRMLWELVYADAAPWDPDLADGQGRGGRHRAHRAAHARPRAGRRLPLLARARAASSPATPCSRAGPARPAAPSATDHSRRRSGGCSPCRPTPSSTPVTARTRRRRRASRPG